MFMFGYLNHTIVEKERRVARFTLLLRGKHLDSLFTGIRVKWHFPLVCPFTNNIKVMVELISCHWGVIQGRSLYRQKK